MAGGSTGCSGRPWLSTSSGFESIQRTVGSGPALTKLTAPVGRSHGLCWGTQPWPRHTVLRLGGRVGSHIYWVPIVCWGPHGGTSHLASHLVLKAICRAPVTTPMLQMKRPRLKEVTFTVSSNQDGRSASALSPAFSLPSVWVRGCGKDLMEETRCEELEGCSTVPVSPLRLCGGGRESGI